MVCRLMATCIVGLRTSLLMLIPCICPIFFPYIISLQGGLGWGLPTLCRTHHPGRYPCLEDCSMFHWCLVAFWLHCYPKFYYDRMQDFIQLFVKGVHFFWISKRTFLVLLLLFLLCWRLCMMFLPHVFLSIVLFFLGGCRASG